MAEARTFNFNEVAAPQEKDFQVAHKMLLKEGYESVKPAGAEVPANKPADATQPNNGGPQKDFTPSSDQSIKGYPAPHIDLFDGKNGREPAKPGADGGTRLNVAPPADATPRIQAPEAQKTQQPAAEAPKPQEAPKTQQAPRAQQPAAEAPKPQEAPRAQQPAAEAPKPQEAPRAQQPAAEAPKPHPPKSETPAKPAEKHGPDPSKAKPFSKAKPADGHSLAPGECVRGTASHYGDNDGLYGAKTASGERLKRGVPTVALPHFNNQKEKPFAVEVHNPRTGEIIKARVNDMGPNLRLGRAVDLESATFKRLFRGASGLADAIVCRPK